MEATALSLTVRGAGVAGEVLTLGAVAPSTVELAVVNVTVGASGMFSHTWK